MFACFDATLDILYTVCCVGWVGDILYIARGGVLPQPHAAHKKGVKFGGLPVFAPLGASLLTSGANCVSII